MILFSAIVLDFISSRYFIQENNFYSVISDDSLLFFRQNIVTVQVTADLNFHFIGTSYQRYPITIQSLQELT